MSNNDIIPGFDDNPQLGEDRSIIVDRSRINWKPLTTTLNKVKNHPSALYVKIVGELEAFNASYLCDQLYKAGDY
jgi:hypothetical protein